jgi:hypothetical protein
MVERDRDQWRLLFLTGAHAAERSLAVAETAMPLPEPEASAS